MNEWDNKSLKVVLGNALILGQTQNISLWTKYTAHKQNKEKQNLVIKS